jgi:hypothetical protein
MKSTLPPQLNVKRGTACDFLLKIESNTTANALQRPLGSDGAVMSENLHEINVKRAVSGRFDGQVSAEYSPAHRFTVFFQSEESDY